MLVQIITENGQKTIVPLTADTGTGAPVGTIIEMPENRCPQGYLPMGEQFDETVYPALYQYLGTNTTPYKRSSVTRANPVQLSWTALNTAYYAPDDGEVIITTGSQRIDIYINDERVGMTTIGQVSAFEVKKGDKFLFDDVSTGGSIYMVWFIQNTGYCFIKATSGLTENQQENVLNTINDNLSYSTTEHKTGRKWIDGKDIYEKVVTSIYNVTTTSAEYRDTGAVLPTFNKLIKCELIGDLANVLYYSNESGSTVKIASLGTFQISAGAQFNLEYTKTNG